MSPTSGLWAIRACAVAGPCQPKREFVHIEIADVKPSVKYNEQCPPQPPTVLLILYF